MRAAQDFNQLTGKLPAFAAGSPLVYLTAAFQVRPCRPRMHACMPGQEAQGA